MPETFAMAQASNDLGNLICSQLILGGSLNRLWTTSRKGPVPHCTLRRDEIWFLATPNLIMTRSRAVRLAQRSHASSDALVDFRARIISPRVLPLEIS
jgi:hypothetical protein